MRMFWNLEDQKLVRQKPDWPDRLLRPYDVVQMQLKHVIQWLVHPYQTSTVGGSNPLCHNPGFTYANHANSSEHWKIMLETTKIHTGEGALGYMSTSRTLSTELSGGFEVACDHGYTSLNRE